MEHDELIAKIEGYCAATGLKASTVCVRALGDSRFMDRHQRRLCQIEKDASRLLQYMANNPPKARKDKVA